MINWKPFVIIIQWTYWYKTFNGFAFCPFVFVKDKENKRVVSHELIHIRQQYNHFLIWFYMRYIIQLLVKGYHNIDYEIEAYKNEEEE